LCLPKLLVAIVNLFKSVHVGLPTNALITLS
jgi:hypothetical protein